MQSTASQIRVILCEKLAGHVFTENLFLEWFEDEYAEFEVISPIFVYLIVHF